MSPSKPRLRDLAQRLIACESGENKSSTPPLTPFPVAAPVFEKLRPHLATLMGRMGFRALLAHALARAVKEAPSLRAVVVTAAGTLQRSDPSAAPVDGDAGHPVEDSVALLARLIELLMDFIGVNLTLRLLCDVWPTLLLNERDFNERDYK